MPAAAIELVDDCAVQLVLLGAGGHLLTPRQHRKTLAKAVSAGLQGVVKLLKAAGGEEWAVDVERFYNLKELVLPVGAN